MKKEYLGETGGDGTTNEQSGEGQLLIAHAVHRRVV